MPNPILKIKRGSGAPTSLSTGELAIDTLNKSLFVGTADGPLVIGGEHIFAKKAYADAAVAAEAALRSASDATLTSNLATEVSDRAAAVSAAAATAASNLASESSARQAADATLTTNLASEVSRAQAAEGTLSTNLAGEISRATAAEVALGTRIDNVLHNVDGVALNSLSEVVVAFQAADGTLNGAITSLASSASTGLSNEVTRATAAELALGVRIDGTVSAATALTSRVSAAESDINTLESDLSAEITNRSNAVSSEASTRASADTSLGNRITALETTIDGGTY